MNKWIFGIAIVASLVFIDTAFAIDSTRYLPNGDVVRTVTLPDDSKSITVQHKDGSSETTTITPDGITSMTIRHPDGTTETRTIIGPQD